jgi:nicotinate-nucleotide adenylyltransferase
MKVGILGGTFDPVHNGHLTIAEEGVKQLGLQQILFMPAARPWMKVSRKITSAEHRINMIKRAIRSFPQFQLSTVEIERGGLTFTIETLVQLKNTLDKNTGLFLLMGWDSLIEMPEWKQPECIIQVCDIVAFTRGTSKSPDIDKLEAAIPGISKKLKFINIPPIDISSTEIRKRVALGLSIHNMVPDEVEEYIKEQKLYRN